MISKRKATAIFFYLAMVDEDFSDEERVKIDEICNSIDPEGYPKYKEEIINEYTRQTDLIIDKEDYYDVISEGVDKLLLYADENEEKDVCIRLLLWNLLVVAHSDGDYSAPERRLIKHIVRITDTDKSVFLEMEQLIKTYELLENEKKDLAASNKPYSEIAPLIAEIDSRMNNIKESSLNLIADEEMMKSIDKLEVKPDIVDNMITGIKGSASGVTNTVKDKAAPVITQVGGKMNNFVSGTFSAFSRKKNNKKQQEEI